MPNHITQERELQELTQDTMREEFLAAVQDATEVKNNGRSKNRINQDY